MGCSRREYWRGRPRPPPGYLPDPGIKPGSPALQADFLLSEPTREVLHFHNALKSFQNASDPTSGQGCPPGLGERCGLRRAQGSGPPGTGGLGSLKWQSFNSGAGVSSADFKPRCGAGAGSAQKTRPAAVPLRKVPEVTSTEGILHRTRLLLRRGGRGGGGGGNLLVLSQTADL